MSNKSEFQNTVDKLLRKEYKRSFFTGWDPRFIGLFLIILLCELSLVLFLSGRPSDEYSEREIASIRERFANFILEERKDAEGETDAGASSGTQEQSRVAAKASQDVGQEESGIEAAGTREERQTVRRQLSREARLRNREALTREVSRKGILGLLTGTGSAAEGESVQGLFSGSTQKESQDLDQILSNVDGLKSGGSSTLNTGGGIGDSNVKGSRSGKKATIDDLVADRETAVAEALTRKGDLFLESPADIIGRGRKSTSRSAQALQGVMYGHVSAIQYCYERELKRDPNLAGKIIVRITVNPDGHVTHAEIISSTLNSERVERCILARIRLWKDFPPIDPNEGDVTFRQVYTFGT